MSTPPSLESQIGPDHVRALAEGIAQGEYNLLLGAGASAGARGGGRDVPATGGKFAQDLVEDFALPVPAEPPPGLGDAYEAAGRLGRRDHEGRTRAEYLRARFTHCEPAPWHARLPEFRWRRIWTLNIDDAVEQAYRAHAAPRQDARAVSWTDPHSDAAGRDVQVVHLHGRAEDPDRLVFSVLEYLRATTSAHAWHRVFGDHFQEQPFVVVGATLRGETDFAEVLRRGSQSFAVSGRPSFVVAPRFDPLVRESMADYGLIAVEMTAAEFTEAVRPAVREAERALRALVGVDGAGTPAEAATFLEQFAPLRSDAPHPANRPDFYHGYDPTWADILDDYDAVFGAAREVTTSLETARAAGVVQRLDLFYGPWGTGKSTALLRVARAQVAAGQAAYLFRGENALDAAATAWWLQRRPNTVLFFDRVADYAFDIETLFETCRREGVRALLVGVERDTRVRQVRSNVSARYLAESGERHMRRLTDADIDALLATLRRRARLGRITRFDARGQRAHFADDAKRQLFTAMSGLEGGPGFVARLTRELEAPDLNPARRDLLAYVAFAYEFGYALPLGVATHATGLSASEVVAAAEHGPLRDWLSVRSQGLVMRHRHIANLLVHRVLQTDARFRLTQQLARSLAPRVTRDAIYNRTIPYLIVRNLLDAAHVARWVGPAATAWYADLAPEYGWNARYWEQRALASADRADFATARSFAERALEVHRDPFTLTTLANVILRQTAQSVEDQGGDGLTSFLEAADLLSTARDTSQRQRRDDHAFTVFFNGAIRLARAYHARGPVPEALREEVQDWLSAAQRSALYQSPDFVKSVAKARADLLALSLPSQLPTPVPPDARPQRR